LVSEPPTTHGQFQKVAIWAILVGLGAGLCSWITFSLAIARNCCRWETGWDNFLGWVYETRGLVSVALFSTTSLIVGLIFYAIARKEAD